MTNKTTSNKPNHTVHLIYSCTFLLAVFAIIAYSIWNKEQASIQIKAKEERLRIKEDEQIAQKNELKMKILACKSTAAASYSKNWTSACIEQAKITQKSLNNCINEAASYVKYMKTTYTTPSETTNLYNLRVAQCKSVYTDTTPNPHCRLPASIAKGINAELKDFEKECSQIFL